MKRILILFLAIISTLAIFSVYFHSNNSHVEGIYETEPTQSLVSTEPIFNYEEAISKIFVKDFEYIQLSSKEEIVEKLDSLHDYLTCLQSYILNEDKIIDKKAAFDFVKDELDRIEYLCNCYEADYQALILAEIEENKWAKRMEEFPIATTVWLYLTKEMNYNPYVAAGIIGNMMAECGGQTLHLKWWSCNSTGHYGLCQWSPGYAMQGTTLEQQLEFMSISFPKDMPRWSWLYEEGFTYEDFLNMTDAYEAAVAFCVIYERPGTPNVERRGKNALVVLEYFTS